MVLLKAKELKLEIPMPITHQDFIEKKYGCEDIKGFLIDDAEFLLSRMTNLKIKIITFSEEEYEK